MGYFGKQVGKAVVTKDSPLPDLPSLASYGTKSHFATEVGKPLSVQRLSVQKLSVQSVAAVDRCPRCNGVLGEDDGFARCDGRCGRRWVVSGPGRWLDPAALPFGVCDCCRPRLPLVAAEVGAICPGSHVEYLIVPEGIRRRVEVAPLGVCRCCLPPQPLVQVATGLVCRSKPQQHYQMANGKVEWLGLAPPVNQAAVDQATLTAAIDAALSANNAELTIFGLFAPPVGERKV